MEKVIIYLEQIGKDKLLHFMCGMIVWLVASTISVGIGLAVVVVVALGKELYDQYKYGGADFSDFVWTIWMPVLLSLQFILRS